MPSVLEVTATYRDRLQAREARAEAALQAAYRDVLDRLREDAEALEKRIAAAIADGVDLSPAWLYQQERYRILQAQVAAEVGRIAEGLGPTITQLQAEAVVMGKQMAIEQLVESGVRNAVALPNDQLIDLVGRMSNGSPLSSSLDKLGPDASEAIRKALITGTGTGQGVQPVARQIRDALGGNMTRALTISRTEVVGSYRNATLRSYEQHASLLQGWKWVAALANTNPPPCPVCISMHGQVFDVGTPFASHQNCRCTCAPLTKGSRVDFGPTGEEFFERQDDAYKVKVLRKGELAAYKAGDLELSDLVQFRNDPDWGGQRRRRPLRDAVGARKARTYYQEAAD